MYNKHCKHTLLWKILPVWKLTLNMLINDDTADYDFQLCIYSENKKQRFYKIMLMLKTNAKIINTVKRILEICQWTSCNWESKSC